MSAPRKPRRWKPKRAEPGDGSALKPYRWWQPFSRTLMFARLRETDGALHTWAVDVRLGGDANGVVRAVLYRDALAQATSKLPAAFPVPGGEIEVVASGYGLRRCHFVTADGTVRQLAPDRSSAEGYRARLHRRHPGVSRAVSAVSIGVLVVALVLGVPQIVDQVSHIPWIAENVGTFDSPFHLPVWFNVTLTIAALVASTERALRLRYNWLLDGGFFDGED